MVGLEWGMEDGWSRMVSVVWLVSAGKRRIVGQGWWIINGWYKLLAHGDGWSRMVSGGLLV
jgi:hypothetical protein